MPFDREKAYLINLKRRPDRLVSSLGVLKTKLGFENVERINAFETCSMPFFNLEKLKESERGCFRSHIEAWKRLIRSDTEDYAFVFEDDVGLDTKRSIKDYEGLEKFISTTNFDVINLCIHIKGENEMVYNTSIFPFVEKRRKNLSFYPHKTTMFGLGSYIISKKGAKKLLELIYLSEDKIVLPVDTFVFGHRELLDIFLSNKNFFYQKRELGSDIL